MAAAAPDILTESEHANQLKRRTYKAILEMSARAPLLNSEDISLMTGASVAWVRKIMKSDAFIAQRAARVQELYGDKLTEIQNKMLETTDLLISTIAKRIANPDAAIEPEVLLKATAMLLGHINPKGAAALATPVAPAAPAQPPVMIFNGVTPDDIMRARERALEHGRNVTLELQAPKEKVIDVDEDGIPQDRRVRSLEGID